MEFWNDELGLMEELYTTYKSSTDDSVRRLLDKARTEINNILQNTISEVEDTIF